jgi:hypothetical protein
MPRDYGSEYQNYHSKPSAKKQRARNNAARRKMIKAGKAHVGDGKDVAHLSNDTRNNNMSNLALQSKSKNRSFARTKTARRKKS